MVGYTSYLNGVKIDTHKNNGKAIAQALKTTAAARAGGLSGIPGMCDDKTDASGNPGTGSAKSIEACAGVLAADFSSTLISPKVSGPDYVIAANDCNGNSGKLVIEKTDGTIYTGNLLVCAADAAVLDTISFGKDW
jgi:hypothetical protein